MVEDFKVLQTLAKLIRRQVVYGDWEKIIGEEESLLFDTLTTPVEYGVKEQEITLHFYELKMANRRFLVLDDPLTSTVKVYPMREGILDFKGDLFLTISHENLIRLGEENANA